MANDLCANVFTENTVVITVVVVTTAAAADPQLASLITKSI